MEERELIADIISKASPLEKNEILNLLEKPKVSEQGDIAFPCFILAGKLKKNPAQIASDIAKDIKSLPKEIEKVQATGPYLNFFLDKSILAKEVLSEILKKKDKYGSSGKGKGKKFLIEHTSINPNASPHVGRARNALIGDSIARMAKFEGYNTEVHYFVNDVGKQISMLAYGIRGKKKVTFNDLLDIYIKVNDKLRENPLLEKEIFNILNKLENGDSATKKLFKKVVDTCIKGQSKIFNELDIKYDSYDYESQYLWNRATGKILDSLKKTGKLFEDDDKRLVLNQAEYNLSMKAPFLVLTRADKTSLYPLRDIAYTIDKLNSKAEKNILVLGEDHKLYFQQLRSALDLLGYKSPEAIHYSFVLLTDSKMSTREGNVVLLEEFMNEAVSKAKEEMKKRKEAVNEKTAKTIAYAAIKYAMLKVSNEKNVNFDWDTALNFEGESGPYLQYTYARAKSILRKVKSSKPTAFKIKELSAEEKNLIIILSEFSSVVENASNSFAPHILANYASKIADSFNTFYEQSPVLKADAETKKFRIALTEACSQVLKTSLNLLGINVLEKM